MLPPPPAIPAQAGQVSLVHVRLGPLAHASQGIRSGVARLEPASPHIATDTRCCRPLLSLRRPGRSRSPKPARVRGDPAQTTKQRRGDDVTPRHRCKLSAAKTCRLLLYFADNNSLKYPLSSRAAASCAKAPGWDREPTVASVILGSWKTDTFRSPVAFA